MKTAAMTLAVLAAVIGPADAAKDFFGRVARQGTVGLGQEQYAPVTCAYACRSSIAGWMLDCPDAEHHDHGHGESRGMMMMAMPSPACYASNDPFLTSLAWCIKTRCPEDIPNSLLERYWEMNAAGRKDVQPLPKYSYQDALARVTTPPTAVHNSSLVLNSTELVSDFFYSMVYGSLEGIEINISLCNQYTKFYAHVIDPPVFGSRHAVPTFFGLGIVPTRGQALFIFYIWTLNIILSAVNHVITWPNLWFDTIEDEVLEWVGNRVGMLSFANLILAVLFSSRNNILLYLTTWTRSTFVLVHRWTAVISIIQAILHTALYIKLQVSTASLPAEAAYPYWYWGLIGTIALVLIVPGSLLPIRQRAYEFFLAWHLVFALLSMIACFLHIYLRYRWQWGYEIRTVVPLALFGLDWFLLRPLRLLRGGLVRRARIEVVDDDYLRVDVPGVPAAVGGHAYLYFPTLSWRVWENHPFSVVPLSVAGGLPSKNGSATPPSSKDLEEDGGRKVTTAVATTTTSFSSPPGIVFFIRRRSGLTARLARRAAALSPRGLPVLVELYGSQQTTTVTRPSPAYPNLLILAGGVGITAVLALLERPRTTTPGVTKLYWGVRTVPLVQAVEELLLGQHHSHAATAEEDLGGRGRKTRWLGAEVRVSVGKRFNFPEVLEAELVSGEMAGGTTVLVCGPPGMADEVRLAVVALGRRGAAVRLAEERFGW
ncbi:hypothetical protein NEMBOFW57_010381 [Staphylotrichum longicolle]|uniref:Ferric oxidoreductase domain-containing protein n=1 Tax=Staphylotrichum longicolle TaxID=669026 RepID=A0AAD4EMQ4_9PEZI|nr:hypothetical protein NEMBOFW57_010381 [Staphylotrichum longicolle]